MIVWGRRPQGMLLGWFASAGSVARMLFPIASGYLVQYASVNVLFGTVVVIMVMSAACVLHANRTLSILAQ